MCQLCSGDETERLAEIRRIEHHAQELRQLAAQLENMAIGRIKPHSEMAKGLSTKAAGIVRYLVAEFI